MTDPAGVVDAHTHVLLPPRVATRVRGFFEAHGYDQLAYPLDPDVVLARLAADGVVEAWSLPYAHRPGTARAFNVHSAEVAAAHAGGPVRIVPGATVHPGDDDPRAVVAEALDELGCRVLKLHCSVGDFTPTDPRLRPALQACAERGVPVVVHLGHAVDGTTAAHEAAPLGEVAAQLPEVTFVAAHAGHPATSAVVEVMRAHPNVHADLTPVLDQPVEVPATDLVELADRVLFGSDAPNTGVTAGEGLARLAALALPPPVHAAILGGTARRLVPA